MSTREESLLNEHLKNLRVETLEKGFPFMLHDSKIASEGFIYEFPNGSMKIMALADNLQTIVEVRTLEINEIKYLRKKHKLPAFQYA
ncbi:hypothetical protein [Dyadobacter sp. CY326]|uniref:hypothetical protein n=1 Tax=Dyadobacter sp. CY326 TaxID=2907300 RepID=UPI001F2338EB|nr:hypothetical protein [Dyadobacter sp. CY326]MCE7063978.1 hypothetical protein [Dyadobacter sp. CY326]